MGERKDQDPGGAPPADDPDLQSTDMWGVDSRDQTPLGGPDFTESLTGDLARDLSQTLQPGKAWGRYDLGEQLGVGGMGVVHKAMDPTLLRPVALKFLRHVDAKQSERFFREARAQARIKHPYICEIYEAGIVDGEPFIAMQYIDGDDLGTAAKQMRLEELLQLMSQVAAAAHAAHRLGLVHRDLKPGNVMVEQTEDGGWHPYVMDFGLVRDEYAPDVTATGAVLGTLHYMAPEQAAGERDRIDRRTDVYSMGAMMYRLLLKRPLFESRDKLVHLVQILREDPKRPRAIDPSLPEDVETIILKCLEKRPEDRYASAKALAEDLQRFLDGDPIEARPVGPVRRLIKKARKHRALTAAIAVATAAVLGFGGVALYAQLRAAQQARLARQFGEDANDIEWIMRVAYMAPLHDIRPEQQQVRARMAEIEERMADLGAAAQGPGHYAIGRGHLALGEVELARERLERAWKLGHQDDDVAYALGLAYGQLYQWELGSLDGIADEQLREAREAEAQAAYGDPAVRYLQEGQAAELADPEYVQGLLALYEERFDDALAKARVVHDRSPTYYEAKLLEGQAHNGIGYKRWKGEDHAGARDAFDLAAEAYRAAAETGRSDAAVYEEWCETGVNALAARLYREEEEEADGAASEDPCERTVIADPDRASGWTAQAKLHWYRGRHQAERGLDPSEELALAKRAADAAVAADPADPQACLWQGHSHLEAADYAQEHGQPARALYEEAVASFTRATELAPEMARAHGQLGRTHHALALLDWESGESPLPAWERAVAAHERALALQRTPTFLSDLAVVHLMRAQYPSDDDGEVGRDIDLAIRYGEEALARDPEDPHGQPYAHVSLATALWCRADRSASRGRDPRPDTRLAREHLDRATEASPNWSYPFLVRAYCCQIEAEYEWLLVEDPGATLEQALRQVEEVLARDPDYLDAFDAMAANHVLQARHELRSGGQPQAALAQAKVAVSRGQQIDRDSVQMRLWSGEIELLQAQLDLRRGRSPAAALARARAALDPVLDTHDEEPQALRSAAALSLQEARWQQGQGEVDPSTVEQGLDLADRALRVDPLDAVGLCIRGELHLQMAEATDQPGDAEESRSRAAVDLARAQEINPLLARQAARAETGDRILP